MNDPLVTALVLKLEKSNPNLEIDTALLKINVPPHFVNVSTFWARPSECYKCSLEKIADLNQSIVQLKIRTIYSTWWKIANASNGELCQKRSLHFGEFGEYRLNLSSAYPCDVHVTKTPVNTNLPMLYGFLIYSFLGVLYYVSDFAYRKFQNSKNSINPSTVELQAVTPGIEKTQASKIEEKPTKKKRIKSLDALRGICIVVMCFGNYGAGWYLSLLHVIWNGLHLVDLVFPWFMFIMGTSMAFSFESLVRRKTGKLEILYKVLRRSVILFGLGVLLVNRYSDNWKTMRILGVLQKFGVAYLVVGIIHTFLVVPKDKIVRKQLEAYSWKKYFAPIRDDWQYWFHFVFMIAITALWICITFCLRVPGCPTGYIGPGGLEQGGKYFNCTGGAAGYIDRLFFGEQHLYQLPTCKRIYETAAFDPEGLLGNLMSILIVFFGLQTGQIFLIYQSFKRRSIRLAIWGAIWGLAAGILCKFSKNDGWIPLNKNLWSLSFVLALAAVGNILLIFLYYIIDERGWWGGEPFYFVGMNPILIYLGMEVFVLALPFRASPVPNTHFAHLAMGLWGSSLWVLVAYYMHDSKFYISI